MQFTIQTNEQLTADTQNCISEKYLIRQYESVDIYQLEKSLEEKKILIFYISYILKYKFTLYVLFISTIYYEFILII